MQIPAGGAVRDVPVQPADGARLPKAHLGLGLHRQDPLHPPPARCGEHLATSELIFFFFFCGFITNIVVILLLPKILYTVFQKKKTL